MCVVCRQRYPKKELTRYTCPEIPGGGLAPDPSAARPGRGFYVCRNEECRRKLPKFRGWKKFCKGVRHVEHNAG
ncbi:MAG TPA: YlxR family protein [Desulfomicrobiaceae bacterium]|nr:YlxR family protein [Desulfomicrobiaceae bacterium]